MWVLTSFIQGQTSCSHLAFKEQLNAKAINIKCPSQSDVENNILKEVHSISRGKGKPFTRAPYKDNNFDIRVMVSTI